MITLCFPVAAAKQPDESTPTTSSTTTTTNEDTRRIDSTTTTTNEDTRRIDLSTTSPTEKDAKKMYSSSTLSTEIQSFIKSICQGQVNASGDLVKSCYTYSTHFNHLTRERADTCSDGSAMDTNTTPGCTSTQQLQLNMEKITNLLKTSIDNLPPTSTLRKEMDQQTDGKVFEACKNMLTQEMGTLLGALHSKKNEEMKDEDANVPDDESVNSLPTQPQAVEDDEEVMMMDVQQTPGSTGNADREIMNKKFGKSNHTTMLGDDEAEQTPSKDVTPYSSDADDKSKKGGSAAIAAAAAQYDPAPVVETPGIDPWEARFRELLQYQREHGPKTYPLMSTPLGQWIAEQKELFEERQRDSSKSQLSVHQVAKLKSIDFPELPGDSPMKPKRKKHAPVGGPVRYTWNERFQQLVEYHKRWGSDIYPSTKTSTLGVWVRTQRQAYRNTLQGESEKILSPYQIEKLNSINFVWGGKTKSIFNQRSWYERFQELLAFQRVHGPGVVPFQIQTPLGQWIRRQRLLYKKLLAGKCSIDGVFTEDQIDKLKATRVLSDDINTLVVDVDSLDDIEGTMHRSPISEDWEEEEEGFIESKKEFLTYTKETSSVEDDDDLVVVPDGSPGSKPSLSTAALLEAAQQYDAQYGTVSTHAPHTPHKMPVPVPVPVPHSSYPPHNIPHTSRNLSVTVPQASTPAPASAVNYAPSPTPLVIQKGSENYGRWSKEEHDLFLKGMQLYGRKWKKISYLVKTRTDVQIRTHAQKYFQKVRKEAGEVIPPPKKRPRRPESEFPSPPPKKKKQRHHGMSFPKTPITIPATIPAFHHARNAYYNNFIGRQPPMASYGQFPSAPDRVVYPGGKKGSRAGTSTPQRAQKKGAAVIDLVSTQGPNQPDDNASFSSQDS